MSHFPNKSGDHADTDDILRAELAAAGIPTIHEKEGLPSTYMAELLRMQSGEVKTSVRGTLHGWSFERAWYYWVASGPGIAVDDAEKLHAEHGRSVRVAGHCGCPSPREYYNGLACGSYHIDDPAGLRALADCIKGIVARSVADKSEPAKSRADTLAGLLLEARRNIPAYCNQELLVRIDAALSGGDGGRGGGL